MKANNTISLKLDNVLKILTMNLEGFKKKSKATKGTQFKLSPRIMMNLLLNFESYED